MGIGKIMHEFLCVCVCVCVCTPLILQIVKPQPNYPLCLLFLSPSSLTLFSLQGNYSSPSVSWCSFWCSYCWAKVSLSPGGGSHIFFVYVWACLCVISLRLSLFMPACHPVPVCLCSRLSLSPWGLAVTLITRWHDNVRCQSTNAFSYARSDSEDEAPDSSGD